MNANVLHSLWLAGMLCGLVACGGTIVIDEGSLTTSGRCSTSAECRSGTVCDIAQSTCEPSVGPCSPGIPDGDCPLGRACEFGVCICDLPDMCACGSDCTDHDGPWCEDGCSEGEGCDAGECVRIDGGLGGNSCTAQRPSGLCPGTELCMNGQCVPNLNPCGVQHAEGWCAAGLTCGSGRCTPTVDYACGPELLTGWCGAGDQCSNAGSCQPLACSASAPYGVCGPGRVCVAGACTPTPCSLSSLSGTCDTGYFCSSLGHCLENGGCDIDADCPEPGTFCSGAQACLALESCDTTSDCTDAQHDFFGQGFICALDQCVEAETCAQDEDCAPSKRCSTANTCTPRDGCDVDADCDPANDERCSVMGRCIGATQCLARDDCGSAERCSDTSVCIAQGTCRAGGDCPPSHTCDETSEQCAPDTATARSCTSNARRSSGCDAGEMSCCVTDETCCAETERCATAAGVCVPRGTCVSDADCQAPWYACGDEFTCEPTTSDCGDCPASSGRCTSDNTCLPWGACNDDSHCPAGEFCGSNWACTPVADCGFETVSGASLVPPNVLIALDRSGSMNVCGAGDATYGKWCGQDGDSPSCCTGATDVGGRACEDCTIPTTTACTTDADCEIPIYSGEGMCMASAGVCARPCLTNAHCGTGGTCSCSLLPFGACEEKVGVCATTECVTRQATDVFGSETTRWQAAVDVVNAVTQNDAAHIQFGLTTYPFQCANTDPCWLTCNWLSCTGDCDGDDEGNVRAGVVNVPVRSDAHATIASALSTTYPGGGTPTASTLRGIIADPAGAGLADADRENVVLLVTDGRGNGDERAVSVCESPCDNGVLDTGESDVDCGGPCTIYPSGPGNTPGRCALAMHCRSNGDCDSDLCLAGVCRPTSCQNGTADAGESSLDCGGPCLPCESGDTCSAGTDCGSGLCVQQACSRSSCTDGIYNGSESDADCGGACGGCADTQHCNANTDCDSGSCQDDSCRPTHCGTGSRDGDESALDCGGSCSPCGLGSGCSTPADCQSGRCQGAVCVQDMCRDGIRNGGETDTDCGGTCPACLGGNTCSMGADCVSGSCRVCGAVDDSTGAGPLQNCRVNAALDKLYALPEPVRVFVVGLAFSATGGDPALNCHAVHGRGARDDTCRDATIDSCATEPEACYYQANDAQSLSSAFGDIIRNVSSCTFRLNHVPAPGETVSLYLQSTNSGDTSLVPSRLVRELHWQFNAASNQVKLLGAACDAVRSGAQTPMAVFGCAPLGG